LHFSLLLHTLIILLLVQLNSIVSDYYKNIYQLMGVIGGM